MATAKPNFSLLDGTSTREEQSLAPVKQITEEVAEQVLSKKTPVDMPLRFVCQLIANGESIKATSQKSGFTVEDVEMLISGPQGQDMIVRMQAESTPDPIMRLKKLATLAVDVQTRLLLNKHTAPTILAALTRDVLDRAHGKAVQITENRNMNFNIGDAVSLERALNAQAEKLKRIEDMKMKLALPVYDMPASALGVPVLRKTS